MVILPIGYEWSLFTNRFMLTGDAGCVNHCKCQPC